MPLDPTGLDPSPLADRPGGEIIEFRRPGNAG
jgi:hypothetical protein